jgi:drug/metabolite transporter (DMT)-like permease
MAWLIIFNRKSAGDAPMLVMQFVLALFAAPLLVGAAWLLSAWGGQGFRIGTPSGAVIGKCALVALTASTGHLLIYAATMRASAALVSPMTYVQLIAATALGWLWFGDAPDLATYAGAALIIAGGLWLWRSQRAAVVTAEAQD